VTSLSVAVVQGGPSSEAEVSRASARAVAAALREAGHRVAQLELDRWLADSLRTGGYEVVFPAVHGAVGEDGCLQGLLEILEMPYVGSRVLASALAMDKPIARTVFLAAGLPVARGQAFARGEPGAIARAARSRIGRRLVVKPAASGSAIAVARHGEDASDDAIGESIAAVFAKDDAVLVEHFARGREVTCGVIDAGAGAVALPPTEIESPKDAFYTYEARYAKGRSVHTCPAALPPAVFARVQDVAVRAFAALGCRDLARADFIVGDDGAADEVTLLEVNTLPGMTETSLLPEAAAVAGHPFPKLMSALVTQAFRRGPTRRNIAIPLPK
jgi:D-alanine-D-alanine ligase